MFFKLSNLNSNLALTLGYLNPALNNQADSTMIAKSPEKTRREHPLFPRLLANNGARENALGTTWGQTGVYDFHYKCNLFFCLPLFSLLINPCCRRASYAKTTGVESGFLWEHTAVNFKFERPHLHVSRYLKKRRVFSPFSEKLCPHVACWNRFRPSTRKRKYDSIPRRIGHALYAVSHHRI